MMTLPVMRELVPGQEMEAVSLLRRGSRRWSAFHSVRAAVEHWKWKHVEAPLGISHISLAMAGTEIVGSNYSVLRRFKVGSRFCLSAYGADVVVRPEYRRQRLSYRLAEKQDELGRKAGLEFWYWITQNPVLVRRYTRDFGILPLELTAFLKVADVRRHLRMRPTRKRLLKSIGYTLCDLRNRAFGWNMQQGSSAGKYGISDTGRFDSRSDEFWRKAAGPFTFIGERNSDFLNWRFRDPRAGDFSTRMTLDNGSMTGFIATSTVRQYEEYPEGYIADVLALPGRNDAAEALVRHAVHGFHRSGVNAVHCLLPKRSPYSLALTRCGFVDTKYRETVYIKSGFSRVEDILGAGFRSFGTQHFTYADLDLI